LVIAAHGYPQGPPLTTKETAMSDDRHHEISPASVPGVLGTPHLLGMAFAVGVGGALLIVLLAMVMVRSGPEGEFNGVAWSFRGNGALSVLFAGIPAVLGAGWTGLGLWVIQSRHWLAIAVATGGLLFALGLVWEFVPVLLRTSDWDARVGVAFVVVVVLAGGALAILTGGQARVVLIVSGAVALGALGVVLAVPDEARLLIPLLLAMAVSAPVLAVAYRAGARGSLIGACLLMLLGMLLGLLGSSVGAALLSLTAS
jgi:hypothetical protein